MCTCAQGYMDTNCETSKISIKYIYRVFRQLNLPHLDKELPCDISNQCMSGGTCLNDKKGGYSCVCKTGYTDTNCETRNQMRP